MHLPPTLLQYEYRAPLRVLAEEESKLRRADLEATPAAQGRQVAIESLTHWANALELALVIASWHDAVLQLGLMTVADASQHIDDVDALVRTLSHLDPERVFNENIEQFRPYMPATYPGTEPATVDTAMMVRAMQSLTLHCPIEELEQSTRAHNVPPLGHRCRLAFDGVQAFIARHSNPTKVLATAGCLYAEGRASVDEVARLLEVNVPDAIALLEAQGFRRSTDTIRLSEEGRQERLRAIRRDRLERRGEPAVSDEHVARDVIATQRIEGIDARAWLRM